MQAQVDAAGFGPRLIFNAIVVGVLGGIVLALHAGVVAVATLELLDERRGRGEPA